MDFQTYLKKTSQKIHPHIRKIVNSQKLPADQELRKLFRLFLKSATSGKCMRGALVILGFQTQQKKLSSEVYKVAAAYEILHTALLVHDDIIDKSRTRRGKPAIHTEFSADEYGRSLAICIADWGFFQATKIISETSFPNEMKVQALSFLSTIIADTIIGEALDVRFSKQGARKNESEVLTIYNLKTAQYSIVGPLSLGAILARVNKKNLPAIKAFGEQIGIAFQIQDDILGIFGDENLTGKSATSDIEENKNSLLIAYAQKYASSLQKKFLQKHYGTGSIDKKTHKEIRTIFKDSGALEYCQKKSEQYLTRGVAVTSCVCPDEKIQALLSEFARFAVVRKK